MAAPITFKVARSCSKICEKSIQNVNFMQRWFRCSMRNGNEPTTQSGGDGTAVERPDPFPIFVNPEVQTILKNMTGFDMLKVAGPHKKRLQRPKYKLLTDEELNQELKESEERLRIRLQIPPFMNPRKPFLEPLAVDPDLACFDTSDYVFTDVTFGVKDRDRNVVMRKTDGRLVVAPWDVKERMNQIYNPREGRQYLKPSLFKEENLNRLIREKKYVYVLDCACCQFEPDDPDFIRTTHAVYSAVQNSSDFDLLRSTRHFGSLAFYLAWHRSIDTLLMDMLKRDRTEDARDLIRLYCIIHSDQPCAVAVCQLSATDQQDVDAIVKAFIATESSVNHRSELELCLQTLPGVKRSSE